MSKRILVVEDDAALGVQVVERLKNAGYDPIWWKEGRRIGPGDLADVELVLLDLMLPGTYGLDMLKDLRSHCDVPVLVLGVQIPPLLLRMATIFSRKIRRHRLFQMIFGRDTPSMSRKTLEVRRTKSINWLYCKAI